MGLQISETVKWLLEREQCKEAYTISYYLEQEHDPLLFDWADASHFFLYLLLFYWSNCSLCNIRYEHSKYWCCVSLFVLTATPSCSPFPCDKFAYFIIFLAILFRKIWAVQHMVDMFFPSIILFITDKLQIQTNWDCREYFSDFIWFFWQ